MKMIHKMIGFGAVAALGSFAGATHAATVVSGNTYDGWQISIGSPDVSLFQDPSSSSTLTLEKFAVVKPTDVNGLGITFTKTGGSAASSIVLSDETITNHTTVALTGFEFLLTGTSAAFTQSLTSPFAPPPEYTSFIFSPTTIIYTGNQPNGDTSDWGFNDDGDLVINPGTDTTFTLMEIPIGSGGPFGPPAVPLPASAWEALVGLAGLGAIRYGKAALKLLA